jgi:hypothetical protein
MGPRRLRSSLSQHFKSHSHGARLLDLQMVVLRWRNRRFRLIRNNDGRESGPGALARAHDNRFPAPLLHSGSYSILSKTGTRDHCKDSTKQGGDDDGSALSSASGFPDVPFDRSHLAHYEGSRRDAAVMSLAIGTLDAHPKSYYSLKDHGNNSQSL